MVQIQETKPTKTTSFADSESMKKTLLPFAKLPLYLAGGESVVQCWQFGQTIQGRGLHDHLRSQYKLPSGGKTFTADEVGTYLGQCAEYCGTQHANMLIRVDVKDETDFEAWARNQALPAPDETTPSAVNGRKVFLEYACRNCHGVAGLTEADFAPDLTHLMSRNLIAGGMLPNTIDNLKAWIEDPQAIKPGCDMPALQLTRREIEDVVAYLATLK